jgi:hypothetical protein
METTAKPFAGLLSCLTQRHRRFAKFESLWFVCAIADLTCPMTIMGCKHGTHLSLGDDQAITL